MWPSQIILVLTKKSVQVNKCIGLLALHWVHRALWDKQPAKTVWLLEGCRPSPFGPTVTRAMHHSEHHKALLSRPRTMLLNQMHPHHASLANGPRPCRIKPHLPHRRVSHSHIQYTHYTSHNMYVGPPLCQSRHWIVHSHSPLPYLLMPSLSWLQPWLGAEAVMPFEA